MRGSDLITSDISPFTSHLVAAGDSRLYNLFRYDEVTAQAPGLADDRDRDSGDSFHLLFRKDTGLRADARGQVCSHL